MTVAVPAAVRPDELVAALRWRYACKKFDPSRRIPPATWSALEQSLLLAPSSFGLQPWRFVVVEDPALRERLLPHAWKQRQVVDASHFVVVAARRGLGAADVERHLQRIAQVRGVTRVSLQWYADRMAGFFASPPPGFDVDDWAARQAYIALGFFLQAAALLGVDTVPMEGIEPAKFDEILGLPAQGYGTVVAAAAGYRAADDAYAQAAKVRFEAGEVVVRA